VTHMNFLDATLRDGQQSLWGMRMQAGMAAPVAPLIDRTGYSTVDVAASSFMEVLIKYKREDPWAGLDLMMSKFKRTPVRGGMRSNACISFGTTPDALMDLWMRRLNEHGVRSFWIYDVLFNIDKMARLARVAKEYGSEVSGTILFALSPIHTDEYYADKVRRLAAVPEIDTILFYDTAGVIDTDRLRSLIPTIIANANGKPIEMHSNNLMGVSGMAYCEAARLGVRVLHTCVRSMANGPSTPSIESMVRNVELMGFTHSIDTSLLQPVSDHFERVGKAEGYLVNQFAEYDLFSVQHQIPGGMTGTLKAQLEQYGMTHRMGEVLEETARVRRELGYPIMATPFSQLVGIQSVLNIVTDERYSVVPDEVVQYAARFYGEPPAPIDADIMDRIMAAPRAAEIVANPPEQPTLDELRARFNTTNDDDLILRALVPESDLEAMRAAGPIATDYPLGSAEIEQVRALLKAVNLPYMRVATESMDIVLQKNAN
jgi:oxaloacetate decarboxylase (Na+ extruding) subunit alpha